MVSRSRSLFDGQILGPAIVASFQKLDPRVQLKNPVMFICEVGALVTLIYAIHDTFAGNGKLGFDIAISIWLWFTVVFANFAEAVAEGRGKAQAEFLRRTKTETNANRIVDGKVQVVNATQLRKGDRVRVIAGELIPADGEIVEGAATVDESAITGESAPVIREAGGDRSSVTGGTRVLSDEIVFLVGANPGESFLDRMSSLVEGAPRQTTPT
jgi:potassium-transporting ATPase ATP-binding subunit